jgi:hypothetical protein
MTLNVQLLFKNSTCNKPWFGVGSSGFVLQKSILLRLFVMSAPSSSFRLASALPAADVAFFISRWSVSFSGVLSSISAAGIHSSYLLRGMDASDGANVEAFVDANVSKEAERNYITQAADCVRILPLLEFDLVLDRSPDTFAIHHLRRNGSVIGDEKK